MLGMFLPFCCCVFCVAPYMGAKRTRPSARLPNSTNWLDGPWNYETMKSPVVFYCMISVVVASALGPISLGEVAVLTYGTADIRHYELRSCGTMKLWNRQSLSFNSLCGGCIGPNPHLSGLSSWTNLRNCGNPKLRATELRNYGIKLLETRSLATRNIEPRHFSRSTLRNTKLSNSKPLETYKLATRNLATRALEPRNLADGTIKTQNLET